MLTGLQDLHDAPLAVKQADPLENLRILSTADLALAGVVGAVPALKEGYPQNSDTQFS
jgi:hypothetical protein